jgi:hypothetical protein
MNMGLLQLVACKSTQGQGHRTFQSWQNMQPEKYKQTQEPKKATCKRHSPTEASQEAAQHTPS